MACAIPGGCSCGGSGANNGAGAAAAACHGSALLGACQGSKRAAPLCRAACAPWARRRGAGRRAQRRGVRQEQLVNPLLGVRGARLDLGQLRRQVLRNVCERAFDLGELLLGMRNDAVELAHLALVVNAELLLNTKQLDADTLYDGLHGALGLADGRVQVQADARDGRAGCVKASVDAKALLQRGRVNGRR